MGHILGNKYGTFIRHSRVLDRGQNSEWPLFSQRVDHPELDLQLKLAHPYDTITEFITLFGNYELQEIIIIIIIIISYSVK